RLLLLLLAHADFELQHLGILERLMIVARHRVREVLVHVRPLRQDSHQGVVIIAGRAEGPEPLYIRNCHNLDSLTQPSAELPPRGCDVSPAPSRQARAPVRTVPSGWPSWPRRVISRTAPPES